MRKATALTVVGMLLAGGALVSPCAILELPPGGDTLAAPLSTARMPGLARAAVSHELFAGMARERSGHPRACHLRGAGGGALPGPGPTGPGEAVPACSGLPRVTPSPVLRI